MCETMSRNSHEFVFNYEQVNLDNKHII